MDPAPIVCFACGQDVLDPPALNTLPDGRNCRLCADRVLASQPGIFHEPWPAEEHSEGEVLEGPWARSMDDRSPARSTESSDADPGPEPPARA